MKTSWRAVCIKFDALSLRERAMVTVALLAAVFFIPYSLFISPAQERQRVLAKEHAQHSDQLAALTAEAQVKPSGNAQDAVHQSRAEALKRQLAEMDDRLRAVQQHLISAQQVTALLQEVLARDGTLELVALRTLPVAPLAPEPLMDGASAAAQGAQRANVYKHGVEITVQGSYAALHDYLARLEQSRSRMFWARAQLDAVAHPHLVLKLTIYTLSLDRAWLQV
jgi:MSHA biogenesis protein MshJ